VVRTVVLLLSLLLLGGVNMFQSWNRQLRMIIDSCEDDNLGSTVSSLGGSAITLASIYQIDHFYQIDHLLFLPGY
jgi:hypothetical protein